LIYRDLLNILEILIGEHIQLEDIERKMYGSSENSENLSQMMYKTTMIRLKPEYEIYDNIIGKPKREKNESYNEIIIKDIQVLLNDYEQTRPDKKVAEVKTDEVVAEESRTQVDDILDNIDIEVSVKDSVVLENTMQKAYAKYAAKQTAAGKKPITLDKWINSEDGKNIRAAFIGVKKIWIDKY
jgi:CxxC motif-containing protein